jgi:hypothetical protein
MPLFKIEYYDPEKEENVTVEKNFDDWRVGNHPRSRLVSPAKEVAEDWAYMAADKHWYQVTPL